MCEDEELTYRELDERSNQLAHYLQKNGVGCESLVGICVTRSSEMIVGLLGIMKAGGDMSQLIQRIRKVDCNTF